MVEHSSDFRSRPTSSNEADFLVDGNTRVTTTYLEFKPFDARLWFTRWSEFRLPQTPPIHHETVTQLDVVDAGHYKVDYYGSMTGKYAITVDMGPISQYLGANTAILYGVVTLDPSVTITVPSDWQLTVDFSQLYQWSLLVFTRAVAGTDHIPQAWFFKYVGQLLPNLGKVSIGVKLFGKSQDADHTFSGRVGTNLTLSALEASGELTGRPSLGATESD